jgi:hypothetical protein
MTNSPIDKPKTEFDDRHLPDYAATLLREARENARVMLQAADQLKDLGYEDIAIALHDRSVMTGAAIVTVTSDIQKPIVIEVRGGVVQDVQNVPSGILYEIRDYDNAEEAE